MSKLPLYKQINKHPLEEGSCIEFSIYKAQPLICDHIVKDKIIVSGAYWIACINSLLKENSYQTYQIDDLVWLSALEIKEEETLLSLFLHSDHIILQAERIDLVHARIKPLVQSAHKTRTLSISQIQAQATVDIVGEIFYQKLSTLGFAYGPSYRIIEHLSATGSWSLAKLEPQFIDTECEWPPALIDAAFQTCLGIAYANQSKDSAHLPFSIKTIKSYASLREVGFIYVLSNALPNKTAYHLFFLDGQGIVLAMIQDFMGRRPSHVRT